MPSQAKFIQALAAKSLETVRLTESLSVDSESPNGPAALAEHLGELRQTAAELGFVHLEAALRAALGQLEEESFGVASVLAVRVLAGRYEELAAMPSQSGTQTVVSEALPSGETVWKAIAELRALIEQRSCGAVRFEDAAARQILDHVAAVLDPLARFEECLIGGTEARGDLEELGVAVLFRAVRRLRPDTRVVLQDPWSLFEVELSGGRIVDVTRTTIDGTVTHGTPTLMSLGGMSSGRFVVAEPTASTDRGKQSLDEDFEEATRRLSARQGAVKDVVVLEAPPEVSVSVGPAAIGEQEVTEAETERESEELRDPLERENVRAQSAVSMHREPANRMSRLSEMIWRRRVGTRPRDDELRSGFGLEIQLVPKVLGWGFAAVFCATVGFLLWREGVRSSEQVYTDAAPASEEAHEEPALAPTRTGLLAHAGELRPSVDPSLALSEAQGVLELLGPAGVAVHIDGVDRGPLPLTLVLDEGRHVVRYRIGESWTYRFYYVKAGATRVLHVSATRSGFVDAL